MTSQIKLAFGGLLAMASAMGIGRFVYTPILPYMAEALGWKASSAGLVASANFAGYLAGALAASRPIPRRMQRWGLLTALIVSALTTAANAAAGSTLVSIAVMRFVGGVASAYVIVLASTVVLAGLARAGHSGLAAVHFAGVGVGIMISALAVAFLDASGFDWRGLWLGAGALSLLGAAGGIWLVPADDSADPTPVAAFARPNQRGLAPLVTAYGLFGFGYVITATFIVSMVRGTTDAKGLETGIWIAFGLAAVPSVALWSWLGRQVGIAQAFAVAALAEAAGVAASAAWISSSGLFASAVLLGGTFMGMTALGLMAAREIAGSAAQRTMAMMTASFASGQMIGPLVAGILADLLGGMRVPTLLAAAALVVAAALGWVSHRASKAQRTSASASSADSPSFSSPSSR